MPVGSLPRNLGLVNIQESSTVLLNVKFVFLVTLPDAQFWLPMILYQLCLVVPMQWILYLIAFESIVELAN